MGTNVKKDVEQPYTDGDEEEEVDYENHEKDEEHISEEGEVEFPEIEGIPIFPDSSITKDELLSLVLAFKLRHNLNRKYNRWIYYNEKDLLNVILPDSVPQSLYYFDKVFHNFKITSGIRKDFYCSHCLTYLCEQDKSARKDNLECTVCNKITSEDECTKKRFYFLTTSLATQLRDMLESPTSNLWDVITGCKTIGNGIS